MCFNVNLDLGLSLLRLRCHLNNRKFCYEFIFYLSTAVKDASFNVFKQLKIPICEFSTT